MSRPSKMPDKLTRVAIYAHCPKCSRSRRACAADPDARELYVKCSCDINPLFSEPYANTISLMVDAVGKKGGLTAPSVAVYAKRAILWRQASHLRDALIEMGAVDLRLGPTLNGVLTNERPSISEVLYVMPVSALHPGVEEWVALAQRVIVDALACGEVTEEE